MDVEITINGKKIKASEDLTILEAASRAGIKIPTLCYLQRLIPIGSCRICSVEVKGIEHPVPSCVAKVKEGYEIQTDSERVREIRRDAVSHLLLDHPLDCPVCDKSGDCLLQDLSFEFGLTKQDNKKLYPDRTQVFDSKYIEYMSTRCVLCSRCIRVCSDMYGDPFLEIKYKGYDTYIGPTHDDRVQYGSVPEGTSFKEIKKETNVLDCYYCGNCIEVCPVGALISKSSKFKARYWQELPFSSICDKCSAGCRIEFYRYPVGESIIRTAALHGGFLCKRGFFYEGIEAAPGYYIQYPLIKKNSVLVESSTDEALEEFVLKIKSIREKGGIKNTAVLVSSDVSMNGGYLIADFIKNVLKPPYFDINESRLYSDNFDTFRRVFVNEEFFDIKEIKNGGTVLYAGSLEDDIPFALYNIMGNHRYHGGKLLFVNINRSVKPEFTKFEDIALHRKDIDLPGFGDFLLDFKKGLEEKEPEDNKFAGEVIKSEKISIVLGDYLMSSRGFGEDIKVLKEILSLLRGMGKKVNLYPLIKPLNYRGLMEAGLNTSSSGVDSIYEGIGTGRIKNLIFFGNAKDNLFSKELTAGASGLEFLAVIASKTGVLSSMADVVIPVKDFLEEKNAIYENFEGKISSVNNEFNIGNYSLALEEFFSSVYLGLGFPYDNVMEGLKDFVDSFSDRGIKSYNKFKPRSRFYFNDKTVKFY